MELSQTSGDEDQVMVDINTTPLIDVMLVLLIMFIITIPIQTHAIRMNVGLTDPVVVAPPKPPEVIRVDVDFDGRVSWNGEAVDTSTMEARLRAVAAAPNQPEIHLRPDKLAAYRHVAMVLAASQRLGVVKIGIVGNEQFL
jgi:biopolymer transport protein ExbD